MIESSIKATVAHARSNYGQSGRCMAGEMEGSGINHSSCCVHSSELTNSLLISGTHKHLPSKWKLEVSLMAWFMTAFDFSNFMRGHISANMTKWVWTRCGWTGVENSKTGSLKIYIM